MIRILGIDPGLADVGWGVVEKTNNTYKPISYGAFKTESSDLLQDRIFLIANTVGMLCTKYKIDVLSMEEIYFTKHSVTSALNVSKVIGAISFESRKLNIPCNLFTPLQIKTAVTGYGKSDKNQIQQMIKILLNLKEIPTPNHASDALAVAICFGNFNSTQMRLKND